MAEPAPGGSTELLDSPAEQAKTIKKLEERLAKKDEQVAELERKNGVQAKALVELAERVSKLDEAKKPAAKPRKSRAKDPYAEMGKQMKAAGYTPDTVENEEEFYTRDGAATPQEKTLEKMGDNMRAAGMTNETAPAHEEEFYTGPTSEVPPLPPVPPPPAEIPTLPQPNVLAERQGEYMAQFSNLEQAIKQFAIARVNREKLLSGGQAKTDIEVMGNELNRVFGDWSESLSRLLAEQYHDGYEQTKEVKAELDNWRQQLADLEGIPVDDRPANFDTLVREAGDNLRYFENYNSSCEQWVAEVEQYHNTIINNGLMGIRKRVDDAMTAERERQHPKLSKLTNWLRSPKGKGTRIAVGIGLVGIGFVGAATGNVPLVAGAVAGRAALRGYGGYMAGRAIGDTLADRGAKKDTYTDIAGYTESGKKRSGQKHRRGRYAAAAGVGLAAAPFVAGALHGTEATPSSGGAAQASSAPHEASPVTPNTPNVPTNPVSPATPNTLSGVSPETQQAFARYLGATKQPGAAENFNKMFGATPDQLAGLKAGSISLEHLTNPEWMQQAGITSEAAKNQFNYLLGQASTSPEAQQQFIDNLPTTLNQLRGV
jgi:hypothetical protein